MKQIIEIIAAIVFFLLAFLTGRAKADEIIIQRIPGDAYKIITPKDRTYYTMQAEKPRYEWVKVEKTAEELRREIKIREWKIAQNRIIQDANRRYAQQRRAMANAYGYTYRPGKLYKITPITRYKWVKIRIN